MLCVRSSSRRLSWIRSEVFPLTTQISICALHGARMGSRISLWLYMRGVISCMRRRLSLLRVSAFFSSMQRPHVLIMIAEIFGRCAAEPSVIPRRRSSRIEYGYDCDSDLEDCEEGKFQQPQPTSKPQPPKPARSRSPTTSLNNEGNDDPSNSILRL